MERVWGRRGSRTIGDLALDVGGAVGKSDVLRVWHAMCHYLEVMVGGGRGVHIAIGGHQLCYFKLMYTRGNDNKHNPRPAAGVFHNDGTAKGTSRPMFKLDPRFEDRYGLQKSNFMISQSPTVVLTTTVLAEELHLSQEKVRQILRDIITTIGESLFRDQTYDLDFNFCKVHLSKRGTRASFSNSFLQVLRDYDTRRGMRQRSASCGVERHRLFTPGWEDKIQQQNESEHQPNSLARSSSVASERQSITRGSSRSRPWRERSPSSTAQRSSSVPPNPDSTLAGGKHSGAFYTSWKTGRTFADIRDQDAASKHRVHVQREAQLKKETRGRQQKKPVLGRKTAPINEAFTVEERRPATAPVHQETESVMNLVAEMRSSDAQQGNCDTQVIAEGSLFPNSPKAMVSSLSRKKVAIASASNEPPSPMREEATDTADLNTIDCRVPSPTRQYSQTQSSQSSTMFLHFPDETIALERKRQEAIKLEQWNLRVAATKKKEKRFQEQKQLEMELRKIRSSSGTPRRTGLRHF